MAHRASSESNPSSTIADNTAIPAASLVAALEAHIFDIALILLGAMATDELRQDMAARLVNGAAGAVARAARVPNAQLKINSLPTELLSAIFMLLPMSSKITASHVCSFWREVALGSPHLWTAFRISKPTETFVDAMLRRTKNLPLSVTYSSLSVSDTNGLDFTPGLNHRIGAHAARIRDLHLDNVDNGVLHLLNYEFPALKRLRIFAPKPAIFHSWRATQRLRTPCVDELVVSWSDGLLHAFGDLEKLISQCPNLRRLYVDARWSGSVDLTLSRPIMSILPHLEEVDVVGLLEDIVTALPKYQGCPHIAVDALPPTTAGYLSQRGSVPRPPSTFSIVPALLHGLWPIDEVQFVGASPGASEMREYDLNRGTARVRFRSGARTRSLLHAVSDVNFGLLRNHLDSVTSFTFDANSFDWHCLLGRIPRLPAVRTFVYAISSMWLPATEWDFPALECLYIGTQSLNYSFDQAALEALIRSVAGLKGNSFRVLHRLVLINIGIRGVIDDRAVERALSALASHIEVRRDPVWDGLSV